MKFHPLRLLILALWLCCPPAAFAQTAPPKPAAPVAKPMAPAMAPIEVGGNTLFSVTGDDEAEALQRANAINARLQKLIKRRDGVKRWSPEDLQLRNGAPTIILGGEEVLSITPSDAIANSSTVPQLAQTWGYGVSSAVRSSRATSDGPLSGIAVTVASSMTELTLNVVAWFPRLLGALLLMIIFWIIARIVRAVTRRVMRNPEIDPNVRQLALALAFYGVWALGLLAILSALGVDSSSIAATVGVSGFVLGFAFKDVLSHFFAGLMLLSSRQLTIGGQIVIKEFEGTVEAIDLRAVKLRLFDGRVVTIPNGDVFNSAVISNTANATRRREFRVSIGLQDNARAAIDLALQTVNAVDGVLDEPKANVVASDLNAPVGLGASSVELRVFFYVASDNPRYFDILSECILRVKDEFEQAGITMPSNAPAIS